MGAFSFPASLLSEDEDLVLDLRPHWVTLVVPAAQVVGIVTVIVVGWLFLPYSSGGWPFALLLAAGVSALAAWPARRAVRWATSHFVVTTDRVIRRSGLVAKQSVEISLERISDIRFHQTIPERLLGAGDLLIESAAGTLSFEDVRHPDQVQKVVFERKELNEQARQDAERSARFWEPGSVADELAKLHLLLRRAVISDREFAELKSELLTRARATGRR